MVANTIFLPTISFYGTGGGQGPRLPDFNEDYNADFRIGDEEAAESNE